jgi:hypothetical protein
VVKPPESTRKKPRPVRDARQVFIVKRIVGLAPLPETA